MSKNKPLFILIVFGLIYAGCDTDMPDFMGAGEEELITTVELTLSPTGGGDDVVVVFNDPDGDGLNPSIGTLNLSSNTQYSGTIALRDDANNEDITAEVAEEGVDHQLWYTPGGAAANRLVVTITDMDENGLPLGLRFSVAVSDGADATASLNVVLSHYDDAPKDGVTLSNESDIDVTFPVNIVGN